MTINKLLNAIVDLSEPGDNYYIIIAFTQLQKIITQSDDDGIMVLGFDVIGPYENQPDQRNFANILDRYNTPIYNIQTIKGSNLENKLKVNNGIKDWEADLADRQ